MNRYKFIDEGKSHLHTLDERPLIGTTTAINEIYPPPLAYYGSAKALEYFGWLKPNERVEENGKYKYVANPKGLRLQSIQKVQERLSVITSDNELLLEEFDKAYKNHDTYKRSKGKEGTDTHAEIEKYILKCIELGGTPIPLVDSNKEVTYFSEWACRDVDKFLWSEAHCYSEKLWIGGICDFGFIHKNGMIIVADNKPSIYPKHFIQTGLYGIQIKENGIFTADGKLITKIDKIDGYMIFDYNTGDNRYRTDIEFLERVGISTIDLYNKKDLIGTKTI